MRLLLEAPLLSRLEDLDLSLRTLPLRETAVGIPTRERLRALGPQVTVENEGVAPNDSVEHFVPSGAGDAYVHVLHVG